MAAKGVNLERFPRVSLCHRPTPLEPLERLSAHLGGPRLFVKRDDCTGLATGGNKTRKLEFLLADALAQGADTVITMGGPQSNHARQTAAAAARLGLKCELVLPRISKWHGPLYDTNGNVLLDRMLGATVHIVENTDEAATRVVEVSDRVREDGGKPYFVPIGGSTALGALGYVDAVVELLRQVDAAGLRIDAMVVTTGSCSTHAGILAGLEALDRPERVIGISIFHPADEAEATVRSRVTETCELMRVTPRRVDERVMVQGEYIGAGYGQPTEAMREAVTLAARLEGLLLDPVYTGKTMSGLVDLVRREFFKPSENVVFWHTGGMPAIFVYEPVFSSIG